MTHTELDPDTTSALHTLISRNIALPDIALQAQRSLEELLPYFDQVGSPPRAVSNATMRISTFDQFLVDVIVHQDPLSEALAHVVSNVEERQRWGRIVAQLANRQLIDRADWLRWNAAVPAVLDVLNNQEARTGDAFFPFIGLLLEECQIPPGYQRDVIPSHLRHLIDTFDSRSFEPITINRRADGSLVVVDGQHRLLVARHFKFPTIQAKVYRTMLQYAEEAQQHLNLGRNHKALSTAEEFNVLVESQDPESVAIAKIIQESGLRLARHAPHKMEPGTVQISQVIQRLYRKDQGRSLTMTLKILFDTWGPETKVYRNLIEGLGRFVVTYIEVFSPDQLVVRLKPVNSEDLYHRVIQEVHFRRLPVSVAGAYTILRLYNYRRVATKQLVAAWIEDGPQNSAGPLAKP